MARTGDIEGYWERYLAEECRRRLHALTPASADVATLHTAAIAPLIAEALELHIRDLDDVERFVRLAFLPRAVLADPWTNVAMDRVLTRTDISSCWRLDFVYLHIVGPSLQKHSIAG